MGLAIGTPVTPTVTGPIGPRVMCPPSPVTSGRDLEPIPCFRRSQSQRKAPTSSHLSNRHLSQVDPWVAVITMVTTMEHRMLHNTMDPVRDKPSTAVINNPVTNTLVIPSSHMVQTAMAVMLIYRTNLLAPGKGRRVI